jgi:hypothetical protein
VFPTVSGGTFSSVAERQASCAEEENSVWNWLKTNIWWLLLIMGILSLVVGLMRTREKPVGETGRISKEKTVVKLDFFFTVAKIFFFDSFLSVPWMILRRKQLRCGETYLQNTNVRTT